MNAPMLPLCDQSLSAESGDKSPQSISTSPHASSPRPASSSPGSTASPDASAQLKKTWPHAPVHKMSEHGVYIVTAGTLHKDHLFHDAPRLDLLEFKLLTLAEKYHWQIEAWAVLANHYHLVCRGCPASANLGKYLKHLHSDSARELNRLDQREGRQVWHNFRETKLTFEKSYLARLNYVHQNASNTVWCGWPTSMGGVRRRGSSASPRWRRCRRSTASRPTK